MDILSEIIAIDDAANKFERDARQEAAALKEHIKGLKEKLIADNEQRLNAKREESREQTDKRIEEARVKADGFEKKKCDELDALFAKRREELVSQIVKRITEG